MKSDEKFHSTDDPTLLIHWCNELRVSRQGIRRQITCELIRGEPCPRGQATPQQQPTPDDEFTRHRPPTNEAAQLNTFCARQLCHRLRASKLDGDSGDVRGLAAAIPPLLRTVMAMVVEPTKRAEKGKPTDQLIASTGLSRSP